MKSMIIETYFKDTVCNLTTIQRGSSEPILKKKKFLPILASTFCHLKGLAQAKIIKKIGDFISGFYYDHMM